MKAGIYLFMCKAEKLFIASVSFTSTVVFMRVLIPLARFFLLRFEQFKLQKFIYLQKLSCEPAYLRALRKIQRDIKLQKRKQISCIIT